MKYIKTFEQFIESSSDSAVNEATGDKEVSNLLLKIITGLEKDLKKEKDSDMIKSYNKDIRDYKTISDLAKSDIRKANRRWDKLDTLARDYIVLYLPKKDAKVLAAAFNVELNEAQIAKLDKNINEDHIEDREKQIEYILANAGPAGYPDLENEEFITALSDTAVDNFYKMIEVIRAYNDSKE